MNNLKKLRLSKGLSQQALAEQLHTTQPCIYKYENELTEPDIRMLKSMADYFDVSVDYLIGFSSCPHRVEEVQETELNQDELFLVQKYRSFPSTIRQAILQFLSNF